MGQTVEYNNIEYNVEIDNYYPGRPAYISGLPEDCYPEDSDEIEWHADTGEILIDMAIHNDNDACEEITNQLLDIVRNYEPDPPEPDY